MKKPPPPGAKLPNAPNAPCLLSVTLTPVKVTSPVFSTVIFQVIVPGDDWVRGTPVLVTVNDASTWAYVKLSVESVDIIKIKTINAHERILLKTFPIVTSN